MNRVCVVENVIVFFLQRVIINIGKSVQHVAILGVGVDE